MEEERNRDTVDVVDRRALAPQLLRLRIRADERVVVVKLELVRVAEQELEVGDAVRGDPGREVVTDREREQGRVAAGTAARDQHPLGIDVALVGEMAGRGDG